VIPDVDIAAKVGKDHFLDEKIPRHESGQGYERVGEHSERWKEKEASKIFTYQELTTCTEVDRSWTIISSAYYHVRSKRGEDERSMAMFIREGAARSGGVPVPNVEGAASTRIVPFQARCILAVAEEQSRPRGGQSGGVEDQPQCRGLCHDSSPRARSLSRSLLPPLLRSHNLVSPAFTSA